MGLGEWALLPRVCTRAMCGGCELNATVCICFEDIGARTLPPGRGAGVSFGGGAARTEKGSLTPGQQLSNWGGLLRLDLSSRAPGHFLVEFSLGIVFGITKVVLHRCLLPSDCCQLPSNRRWLPSDHHRLPSNRRRLPSDHHRLPSNRRRLSSDHYRLPSNRRRLPCIHLVRLQQPFNCAPR